MNTSKIFQRYMAGITQANKIFCYDDTPTVTEEQAMAELKSIKDFYEFIERLSDPNDPLYQAAVRFDEEKRKAQEENPWSIIF